jgi:chromosome segregation ATPase
MDNIFFSKMTTLVRENQNLHRENQNLNRETRNLIVRLSVTERERDRLEAELRHAQNNARELNNDKLKFQRRCEQLEREKMSLRHQVTVCRRCTGRINGC